MHKAAFQGYGVRCSPVCGLGTLQRVVGERNGSKSSLHGVREGPGAAVPCKPRAQLAKKLRKIMSTGKLRVLHAAEPHKAQGPWREAANTTSLQVPGVEFVREQEFAFSGR